MAPAPRVLIVGGYGVFGRLLSREILDRTTARVVVAGRRLEKAIRACDALDAGDRAEPLELELGDPAALARAALGCAVVACTAGPFQGLPRSLPAAALEAGAHWVDIGDGRDWILDLLKSPALEAKASDSGRLVIPGLSVTPALSGVLVRCCARLVPDLRRARITLFIGNRNAKGAAAIASFLTTSSGDPLPVDLPLGRRMAHRFDSADASILRDEMGIEAEFRVAFEWDLIGRLLSAAPLRSRGLGSRGLARTLSVLSLPFSRMGSDLGCLHAEAWDASGRQARATLIGRGQGLAIHPCVVAVESLLSGERRTGGVVHPARLLLPEEWIGRLESRGTSFVSGT